MSKNEKHTSFSKFLDSSAVFIKYLLSAAVSFLLDLLIFTVVISLFDVHDLFTITLATVTARFLSSIFNYLLNRFYVFKATSNKSAVKYFSLVTLKIGLSSLLVTFLRSLLPVLHTSVIKAGVEAGLFALSYYLQKKLIFYKK